MTSLGSARRLEFLLLNPTVHLPAGFHRALQR